MDPTPTHIGVKSLQQPYFIKTVLVIHYCVWKAILTIHYLNKSIFSLVIHYYYVFSYFLSQLWLWDSFRDLLFQLQTMLLKGLMSSECLKGMNVAIPVSTRKTLEWLYIIFILKSGCIITWWLISDDSFDVTKSTKQTGPIILGDTVPAMLFSRERNAFLHWRSFQTASPNISSSIL